MFEGPIAPQDTLYSSASHSRTHFDRSTLLPPSPLQTLTPSLGHVAVAPPGSSQVNCVRAASHAPGSVGASSAAGHEHAGSLASAARGAFASSPQAASSRAAKMAGAGLGRTRAVRGMNQV